MKYRIMAKDIPVEVDTLDALRDVLSMLWALEGETKPPSISKAPGPIMILPGISEAPPTASQLSDFYRNLPRSHARTMIQALYDKPEGLTREELKNVLGLDGQAFGGAWGSITNTSKPYGLKKEDIVSEPKEGETHYQLTPSMREVIRTEKERAPQPLIR